MSIMHLDRHAQSASHFYHTLGRGSRVQMRMCLTAGDKGRAYVIILALTDGLQALSIHLETHEDVLVPPHPLGSTTGSCLENKGPTPCPLCLESISTSWHPLDFIRPPQRPNYSIYWSFDPLERLLHVLLSYLVGLSPKVSVIMHIILF